MTTVKHPAASSAIASATRACAAEEERPCRNQEIQEGGFGLEVVDGWTMTGSEYFSYHIISYHIISYNGPKKTQPIPKSDQKR
jgi:hypothetical protein